MTEQPEIFRYFAFKEEASRGVAETVPEMFCDAASLDVGIPGEPEMTFEGSMGRGKNIHRPGFYVSSPNAEFGVDIKILARMLYFALGKKMTVTTEGGGQVLPADKVQVYDASGSSYTDDTTDFNDVGADDVTVPGHAAGEVGDFIAFGYTTKFSKLAINVGTAKTDVSTIVWEYWDGDNWVTLTVTDNTTGFTVSGSNTVTFTAPSDWKKKKLGSDTATYYYVRARCSAFTSAGTAGSISQGFLGDQPDVSVADIYCGNNVLLPSFTSFMGMDLKENIVSGCILDKLEFTADDGFLTMSLDMKGMTPGQDDLREEDEVTLNEDYPLAYYEVNLHMREISDTPTPWGAATNINSEANKLTWKIENSASEDQGRRLGSRFPGFIPVGARNIGFSFDYLYLSNKYLNMLWGSSDGPTDGSQGSEEVEFMIEIDAGQYGSAQIWFPRAIVKASPLQSKGKDPIVQGVEIDAYQKTVELPNNPGTSVKTDCIASVTTNWTDTTGAFDGPSWAAEEP